MKIEKLVEADVLVVGGGMAGLFAAIKAREKGVDVVIVDKGYAGKSGSTPYAFWYVVYNPKWGHDLNTWLDYVNSLGEYLNNRDWTEIVFKESYDRYRDLVSYGVEFMLGEDGKPKVYAFPGIPTESFQLKKRVFGQVMRKKAKDLGVVIFDRFMLTDLLKEEKVAGATGFAIESGEFYAFKAKAVVVCSGGSAFKPDGWPVSELTGDGDCMAYRIGAEIAGKEFNEPKSTSAVMPAPPMGMFLWKKKEDNRAPEKDFHSPPQVHALKCINALGEEIIGIPGANFINMEFEVHAGRLPVYSKTPEQPDLSPRVGNATGGMSLHTAEGLWPVDDHGKTTVSGLYAAGDYR